MKITCNIVTSKDDIFWLAMDKATKLVVQARTEDEAVKVLLNDLIEHYKKYGVPEDIEEEESECKQITIEI